MKATQPWHQSRAGSITLWLGSIQLAVPLLVIVAAALVWGTYLESTQGPKVAKHLVYGSAWFIALMLMICVSLIFAVITRYPWRRQHAGFITVHACLIALIVAGFWSLFGRIEGRITLEQGASSDAIETDDELLELVEHDKGEFRVLGAMLAPRAPGNYTIGGLPVKVTEFWENTREEVAVLDGGPDPFRAIEVSLDPAMPKTFWVGEESQGGAARLGDLVIRLLPPGQTWQPPAKNASPAAVQGDVAFVVGDARYGLPAVGAEIFPGWTLKDVKRFASATVSADGIKESTTPGQSATNPAVDVTITDGKGTVERHTLFTNFPDMVLAKTLEGAAKSGAKLVANAATSVGEDTLVIFGAPGALRGWYVASDGSAQALEHDGPMPWRFEAGKRKLGILNDFARAREVSRFTSAPPADQHRPALVISFGDAAGEEPTPLAWKDAIPVPSKGPGVMLRYAPHTVALPFSVKLDKFQKSDYPGTDMAMAYESSVSVSAPGQPVEQTRIFMNCPLVKSGWKVYQSGFMGDSVSIFSVMRDPGLVLTYIASAGLCVGILITFYSRRLSWGHPGIPAPFTGKE